MTRAAKTPPSEPVSGGRQLGNGLAHAAAHASIHNHFNQDHRHMSVMIQREPEPPQRRPEVAGDGERLPGSRLLIDADSLDQLDRWRLARLIDQPDTLQCRLLALDHVSL